MLYLHNLGIIRTHHRWEVQFAKVRTIYTRWFKYDRDYLCVNKSQFVPVIFEPPCIMNLKCKCNAHFLLCSPSSHFGLVFLFFWRGLSHQQSCFLCFNLYLAPCVADINWRSVLHTEALKIGQGSLQLKIICSLKQIVLCINLTENGISPQFLANGYHTGEGKVVSVHARNAYRRNAGILPLILNLGCSTLLGFNPLIIQHTA
jgi:hypothetical protein